MRSRVSRVGSGEGRRGNAMIVGLMLGTLFGFSALSIDIGYVRLARTHLQVSLDSAALSGAGELDGSLAGMTRAVTTAQAIAAANPVAGTTLNVPASDIQVGKYDADTDAFAVWNGIDDPDEQNAVVIAHTPPTMSSVLAAVAFGITGYDLQGQALAIRPVGAGVAKSTECFLPLAIPDCWLNGLAAGTNPPPIKFTFNPTPTDAIAWGDPDGNPNTNDVRNQLLGQCDDDPIEVGDPIYVNEGVHNSALQTIADILNDVATIDPSTWDTSLYGPMPPRNGTPDTANTIAQSAVTVANWGKVLEGPVALVNAGADCSTVSFTHSKPMTQIAWAVIYDVKDSGAGKNVYIQLDVVNEHDIWGEIDETTTEGNVLAHGDPILARY